VGEFHAQTVAGFGRAAAADVIGDDGIVFLGVQRFAWGEDCVGKFGGEPLLADAGGAVEDEDGVGDFPRGVFCGVPK
jgi:hypothetical protein